MNNYRKERIFGSIILLGGGLLLLAMLFRNQTSTQNAGTGEQAHTQYGQTTSSPINNPDASATASLVNEPSTNYDELTADLETEQRILEQKRKLREARMTKQQELVDAYIQLQEEANQDALDKAKRELEGRHKQDEPAVALVPVSPKKPTPSTAAPNQTQNQAAVQARVEAAAKKAAETQAKQEAQIAQLERELKASQEKASEPKNPEPKAELSFSDAKRQLSDTRARAALGEVNTKGTFGVQVALAASQAQADALAKKLTQNGYKVSFSRTSRGVRVLVGPEKGKAVALALKDKINADSRLGIQGAWVTFVDPAHLKAENKALRAQSQQAKQPTPKPATSQPQTSTKTSKPEDNSTYGVQVAMANDEASAKRLIEKLSSAGYKSVTTSNTSRGVRVIVGANLPKDKALALKDKLNADSKLSTSGAWIRRER